HWPAAGRAMRRARGKKRSLPLLSALVVAGCHRAPAPVMVSRPPGVPQQQIAAPPAKPPAAPDARLTTPADTAVEEHVEIDTHGRDVDVREILGFLGQRAGLRFAFSPEINKKVRVT